MKKASITNGVWRITQALFLMLLIGVSIPSVVLAQSSTEAGSVIGNQATSTYIDGSGVERTITSNLVTTTVKQVGAVSLAANQSRYASPGGQVNYPHTITNFGNGPDSFTLSVSQSGDFNMSQILIYADENGDGVPDNQTPITATPELAKGESFRIVVVGYVPSSVSNTDENNITLTSASTFDASKTASVTDNTIVSTNAVISVAKSLDTNSGASGDNITVTLTYTNSGNSTATALLLSDALPSGMSYVPGSARWSITGNSVQLTDANLDAQGTAPQTVTFDYGETAAGTVTATISQVSAGQTGTLTFDVTASGNAGNVENTATFSYNDGTGVTSTQTTNTVQFTIEETASISGTGATIATASQGSYVDFTNTITNDGNTTDIFDVTLEGSTFPAGTSFVLYKSGAAATLLDTDSDGIPDTGPLAPGDSYVVVLRVTLPSNATGGPYSVQKRITSSVDETTSITLTDQLTSITSSTVDLTNDATSGQASAKGEGAYSNGSAALNTLSINPGEKAVFTLYVKNTSTVADSYDLSASTDESFATSVLPSNWTVVFKDASGAIITNTGVLAANTSKLVYAEVSVPDNQAAIPSGESIYFKVASPSTGAADQNHDAVIVKTIRSISVTPNNSGQAYPGGVVVYQHTVSNEGNVTETGISLTVSDSYNGFSSVLYHDVNQDGILDSGDAVISSIASLAPDAELDLLVKITAPNGIGMGINNVTTVTASANAAAVNGVGAPADISATDVTSIITSNVILVKEQSLTLGSGYSESNLSAEPGTTIYYRLTLTNNGSETVTNADIEDITPAHTIYVANSATITAGGVIDSEPAGGASGTVRATIASFAPGESIQLVFAVQIES
ncbi:hypothetical protein [Gracilimonas sp.]|uniref:hypothetical protein n=1 Tax=Gracilimonas sp. TaxID=1974203 RepID=UPI003BAD5951